MRKEQRTWQLISLEVGLLLVYFATRLFRLTLLPMSVDEALHIKWALEMAREGPLAELSDYGKFLILWVMSLAFPILGDNLLWIGRFVSVCFGLLGLVGCYLLGRRLFDRRVGLIGAGLYLVVPFTFFHDRIALMDGPMVTLVIYLVLSSLQFARQPSLRHGAVLGVILMLITLTKLNGFVQGVLPLLVMMTYLPRSKFGLAWKGLLLAYGLGVLGFIPSVVNLSSTWDMVWTKFGVVSQPDRPFWWNWLPNASNSLDALVRNLSLPIFIIVCLGVIVALIQRQRRSFLMIACAGVTLVLFVVLPKPWAWYPRYLLPTTPFLFLIAAHAITLGLNWLKPYLAIRWRAWRYGVIAGFVLVSAGPALWFDYWLVTEPPRASLTEIDRWQYITSKYAGYGLVEAADYLRGQVLHSEHIIVVYAKKPVTLSVVLETYLYDQRQHIIHSVVDFDTMDPNLMTQRFLELPAPVFIVIADDLSPEKSKISKIDFDTSPYLQYVGHFDRPDGLTGINIYKKKE